MYLGRCLARVPFVITKFPIHTLHKYAPQQARLLSISPAQSRFFSPNKIVITVADLDAVIKSEHAPSVRAIYAQLKANVAGETAGEPETGPPILLTDDQLDGILHILARSGKKDDMALLYTILTDIPKLFGLEITSRTHSTIFEAFVQSGNSTVALQWLLNMQDKPGNISPTLPQWHLWIARFVPIFEQHKIPRLISDMHATGCPPTLETYRIIFTAMFRYQPKVGVVKSIIQMQHNTLPYDPIFPALLSRGYTKHRLISLAEEVRTFYNSIYCRNEQTFEDQCNKTLMQTYQNAGKHRTLVEYERMRHRGFSPTIATLRFLLTETVSVQDLRFWEQTFQVKADVAVWTTIIRNCVQRAGSLRMALQVYDQFTSSGLTPNSELILPIIRVLCMKTLRPPKESDIDRALVIYREFFQLTSLGEPNGIVYNTLISALASTHDTAKYFPKALSLLEDMKSREVVMDNMMATSITILLLRSSASPSEAFQAYKRIFKRPDGKPTLDAEGYVAVLNVFCRLTFGKATIHTALPPWEQYFEIVKDMRGAGYPINIKVYTIILQQLGLAATRFRQARNSCEDKAEPDLSQLQRAIRKIHQLLTMDPSIQPDIVAWNTLMDAYQRADCLKDAYRVWDTLWLSRAFDNASVSIIADACGHANALNEAFEIFSRLRRVGFVLNARNWNSWLECLCRLGQLDEAVKMLLLDMGQNGDVEPDEESVRIVFRFAAGSRDENHIRERVRRYLPTLWKSLPNDLTQ